MSRQRFAAATAFALMAIASSSWGWAQIYKITDDEKGVVFTDRPQSTNSSGQQTVEKVELPNVNTVPRVEPRPEAPQSSPAEVAEPVTPTVRITSPANEGTIAMGPGNFAVSASVTPPLSRAERLVLLVDGQPYGAEQSASSWFVEGALRGPHDLVVQRVTSRGKTVALSEPVRIYVLRPSVIGR
jgi:hypothetical protein